MYHSSSLPPARTSTVDRDMNQSSDLRALEAPNEDNVAKEVTDGKRIIWFLETAEGQLPGGASTAVKTALYSRGSARGPRDCQRRWWVQPVCALLRMTMKRRDIWGFFIFQSVLSVLFTFCTQYLRNHAGWSATDLETLQSDGTIIGMITGFGTFALVFYFNSAYGRYTEIYHALRRVNGGVDKAVGAIWCDLPHVLHAEQLRVARSQQGGPEYFFSAEHFTSCIAISNQLGGGPRPDRSGRVAGTSTRCRSSGSSRPTCSGTSPSRAATST